MAPLQARFIFIGFVTIAAAITYNATFLQKGPHPAPMAVNAPDRAGNPTATRSAVKTLPKDSDTTASLPGSKLVTGIQRRLVTEGYEPGPVDGVQGDMTRAAIMAYQFDNGLHVTGAATNALLENMILGISPVGDGQGQASVPRETTALVKAVQKALASLDYEPGPPDGLFGAGTRAAIEKFERDRGFPVRGRISGGLLKELFASSGSRPLEVASD